MPSIVYYGSPRQARLVAKETLPAKLDLILEALQLRERVKNELVALKLHIGVNIGYSTIHPVFVRKVVRAIRDGGGEPFVIDVDWGGPGAPASRNPLDRFSGSRAVPQASRQPWRDLASG